MNGRTTIDNRGAAVLAMGVAAEFCDGEVAGARSAAVGDAFCDHCHHNAVAAITTKAMMLAAISTNFVLAPERPEVICGRAGTSGSEAIAWAFIA